MKLVACTMINLVSKSLLLCCCCCCNNEIMMSSKHISVEQMHNELNSTTPPSGISYSLCCWYHHWSRKETGKTVIRKRFNFFFKCNFISRKENKPLGNNREGVWQVVFLTILKILVRVPLPSPEAFLDFWSPWQRQEKIVSVLKQSRDRGVTGRAVFIVKKYCMCMVWGKQNMTHDYSLSMLWGDAAKIYWFCCNPT